MNSYFKSEDKNETSSMSVEPTCTFCPDTGPPALMVAYRAAETIAINYNDY